MDAFDPQNDMIDQYLRGELQGKALDDFHSSIEADPALKKDVEFRRLLVSGIQERGAVELKNFLRQRTTQKQILRVSFKAWYYAAAALAVILLAASALLVIRSGKTDASHDVAKISEQENNTNSERWNNADSETIAKEPSSDKLDPMNSNGESTGAAASKIPTIENIDPASPTETEYPDAVIIASNIPVQSIRIESALDDVVMMERTNPPIQIRATKPPESKGSGVSGSEITKDYPVAKASIDSSLKKNKVQIAQNGKNQQVAEKFRLSFINTRDAAPQVSLETKPAGSTTPTEVYVYNLPYDNPLIFTLNDKYYLKTGSYYYEINPKKTGKQTVTPVTDKAVIAALEN